MRHAVYGLTGGIACGKSTVAALFAEWGASVVDADQVARDVVQPHSDGLARLVTAFGPEIVDEAGELRRDYLGTLVFSNATARAQLDAMMHPLIAAESGRRIMNALCSDALPVFYEAALLVETGRHTDFSGLVVVACSPDVQMRRLMSRNPELSPKDAHDRIASQMSVEEKVAVADFVIWNNDDRIQLIHNARKVFDAVIAHEEPRG